MQRLGKGLFCDQDWHLLCIRGRIGSRRHFMPLIWRLEKFGITYDLKQISHTLSIYYHLNHWSSLGTFAIDGSMYCTCWILWPSSFPTYSKKAIRQWTHSLNIMATWLSGTQRQTFLRVTFLLLGWTGICPFFLSLTMHGTFFPPCGFFPLDFCTRRF